jgi:hypothetical protein
MKNRAAPGSLVDFACLVVLLLLVGLAYRELFAAAGEAFRGVRVEAQAYDLLQTAGNPWAGYATLSAAPPTQLAAGKSHRPALR